MSTPTSTPLPSQSNEGPLQPSSQKDKDTPKDSLPLLRIHFDDLSHPATAQFLSLVDSSRILPNAVSAVLKHLYPSSPTPNTNMSSSADMPQSQPREVRSITLILCPMSGVAYTTGLQLDSTHKEIHFNLNYIRDCCPPDNAARRRDEIIGVITHEMVHCFQHDALGTAPGGLIEGIADYVRLKSGLAPPHWHHSKHGASAKENANGKKKKGKEWWGERWDEGYQKTAFFLEWLERSDEEEDEKDGSDGNGKPGKGKGTVARINFKLGEGKEYREEEFWRSLIGEDVGTLWERYAEWRRKKEGKEERDEKWERGEKEAKSMKRTDERGY